ncbi:MAG: LCP family protein [Candidatus Saccharibacteria bacterium]|nr:LCP family protein [Candidatus Saccharibacteria bacterium]
MNKKYNSIDGFRVARRPIDTLRRPSDSSKSPAQTPSSVRLAARRNDGFVSKTAARSAVENLKISEKDIFEQEPTHSKNINHKNIFKNSKIQAKTNKIVKKFSFNKKIVKLIALATVLILMGTAVYYFVNIAGKAANVISNVLEGDASGLLKADPLKQDNQKRTNILIFGTESEDINSQHGGPLLTDSIMVASYNNETHQTSMISIPRDLWVRLEKSCVVGYSAKINTVYQCGSDNAKDEKAGADALGRKITEITGLDIHYYVHINFASVVSLVNAIGGVEVIIESPDPRGIYDINSDVRCGNKTCHMVKYPNGPTGLMDGQHALALIRARNAAGGYGLPRSNYDREDNQRKVMAALAKRMMDNGTLLDLNKLIAILDVVGGNIRTNFGTNEMRSAVVAAKEMSSQMSNQTMKSISLVDVTKTGDINGQSVVIPISGDGNYSSIREYIKKQMSMEPFMDEDPTVTILNGSGQTGLAQKVADYAREKNITVSQIGNAPDELVNKGYIYIKAGVEKPQSLEYLKNLFGLQTDVANQAKYGNYSSDFVIVLGKEFVLNQ